jgi:maltooligosyltrehalose trehalohydrolase
VHFRTWAPRRRSVAVQLVGPRGVARSLTLSAVEGGFFEGTHPASPGDRYLLQLDGGEAFPDPASRFQPEGPHRPSEIVDPAAFHWTDGAWEGPRGLHGQVIYELHVGAFTPEGTFAALQARLPELKALGITLLELMPVNGFPGRFNWGYDGVHLFAPNATYGRPEDLRALVDRAHGLGLGVVLDVVYNHLGPDGNYLGQFTETFNSPTAPKEWGDAPNLDGPGSGPVRAFFAENAARWIAEYHLDGLRVDATQSLHDRSPRHLCAEISQAARAAAGRRRVLLIAESEPQASEAVLPVEDGGWGMDALWVDDFHHAARVAATGQRGAYLRDYEGTARELLACALRNSLYQGQHCGWQDRPRGGTLRRAAPSRAVFYLENHDQVANQLPSLHLHALCGAPLARALTAYWLLLPQVPMLFMGQEFFSSAGFYFFADHAPELARAVHRGRRAYLGQFPSAHVALEQERWPLPEGEAALAASRLDWGERARHAEALAFHAELLRLRREDPVFSREEVQLDGATLGDSALVLRFAGGEAGDRLVLLNLGAERTLSPCPEPLLPPGPGRRWALLLSSSDSRYGGTGACFPDGTSQIQLPGRTTLALRAEPLGT